MPENWFWAGTSCFNPCQEKTWDASEAVGKRIDHITSELQEAIMRTRMQPIGNVFNKFPRVARDMARSLGKEVELTLEGKDVELDKTTSLKPLPTR